MLQRAPLVIVAVTRLQDHPKVPRDELRLSTAAGIQNMLTAAWALGLGAIWRTGDMVHSKDVRQALGLTANDVITGFVYIGHASGIPKQPPVMLSSDFVSEWNGETLVKTND
jgi:nitroreductase